MLRWLILSLLLTPLFDARAAGDEAAVRATFAAYKAAVLAQQGERAADNVTTGTLRVSIFDGTSNISVNNFTLTNSNLKFVIQNEEKKN